jgi:uncharacterized membrane protein YfcA
MKILLALAAGAGFGWLMGHAIDNGWSKWLALALFLIVSAVLFVEYFTQPGPKRGRK